MWQVIIGAIPGLASIVAAIIGLFKKSPEQKAREDLEDHQKEHFEKAHKAADAIKKAKDTKDTSSIESILNDRS